MKRYLKTVFCLAFLALAMEVHVPLVLCQDEVKAPLTESVSGTIASVDQKKLEVVVTPVKKYKEAAFQDVAVQIVDSTSIEKNYETALPSDLSLGDKVDVQYTVDPSGKNIAKSIMVGTKQEE